MTSGQEMNVEVAKHGETVVASPVGEIDLARSPSLRSRLAEVLKEKPSRLIIDLAQVPYMDSSGVATLVEALQLPPTDCTSSMCCPLATFTLPWNIMCSKRWARPLWPRSSSRLPTS